MWSPAADGETDALAGEPVSRPGNGVPAAEPVSRPAKWCPGRLNGVPAGETVSNQLYSYWKSVFDITKNINI